MYNSIIVATVIRIWEFILFEYNRSFLKKTIDASSRVFIHLSKGSRFKSIFKSRESMIAKSFIYAIYDKFMHLINKILGSIRKYIEDKGKYSLIYSNIYTLFRTKVELLRSFFIFVLSFAIALAVSNIIRGNYSGRSYIIAIILVIGSVTGLGLKENYAKIIKGSFLCQFVLSVFAIEEGLNSGD